MLHEEINIFSLFITELWNRFQYEIFPKNFDVFNIVYFEFFVICLNESYFQIQCFYKSLTEAGTTEWFSQRSCWKHQTYQAFNISVAASRYWVPFVLFPACFADSYWWGFLVVLVRQSSVFCSPFKYQSFCGSFIFFGELTIINDFYRI